MSQENVELVRSLQPSHDADLVALFSDESTATALMEAVSPFFHEDFEIVAPTFVGGEGARFVGLEGLRAGWLDWLAPWESYRSKSRTGSTGVIRQWCLSATTDGWLEWPPRSAL
jgi:hypothetical protein